ncbi:MAG: DUF5615 family PIN-like protein [Gemmataceae bacterium]
MPRTIKFHLDENCDPRIAVGLRLHGINIITAAEADLLAASDEDHLAYMRAEARSLITQDADFLRIAANREEHPGILYYAQQTRTIGDVIRAVRLYWELCDLGELHNRVEYL